MQGDLQLQHHCRQSFQGKQISSAPLRMTALAQTVELALLAVAQPFGASAEMGLFQRFRNQAPAERRPRESPGSRVR